MVLSMITWQVTLTEAAVCVVCAAELAAGAEVVRVAYGRHCCVTCDPEKVDPGSSGTPLE